MYSSPPVRAPKLQLAVEQPLTGGHWNPPKKDNPHANTRKKPCEMVGSTVMIKPNPISARWVTHNPYNNTKEVLLL